MYVRLVKIAEDCFVSSWELLKGFVNLKLHEDNHGIENNFNSLNSHFKKYVLNIFGLFLVISLNEGASMLVVYS